MQRFVGKTVIVTAADPGIGLAIARRFAAEGAGLYGDYGFAAYNAAKGAVVHLTRNLAIDPARDGVRVNAVCPGLTETPATRGIRENNTILEEYLPSMPMGRPGKPEEIAAAVAFLALDDTSYITGHGLGVDGGLPASV